MATTIFACGLECGVLGSTGMHIHQVTGTCSISTSVFRTGLRSLRSNPSAARAYVNLEDNIDITNRVLVARFYIRFDTFPAADTSLFGVERVIGNCEGLGFQASDSKLYPYTNTNRGAMTFGSLGFAPSLNVFYRVDIKIDCTANPRTIDIQIDGNVLTQLTRATAAQNLTFVEMGGALNLSPSTPTDDVFYEDILFSQTAGDYPLGAGQVDAFSPSADGTHNITIGVYKDEGLNLITNSTTTAYQKVNDVPLDSTTFIDQTVISATDYFEVLFPDTTQTPRHVDAIIAIGGSASAASWKLNDSGTLDNVFTGNPGAGTPVYKRKGYATKPSGGAWTTTAFNALTFQSLFASDVTPNPITYAIMLEMENLPSTVSAPTNQRRSLLGVGF